MTPRIASIRRETRETFIELRLDLDGGSESQIGTGIRFLDHMLESFALHGGFGLSLSCRGDMDVDDHHSVEDCAIVLGQAFDEALGDRAGIVRFAHAYAPLDEALVRTVVDLSGRPFSVVNLPLSRERLGDLSCENVAHFFQSFAIRARAAVHIDLIRGGNDHHKVEAAFKSAALALRCASALTATSGVASTKGVL